MTTQPARLAEIQVSSWGNLWPAKKSQLGKTSLPGSSNQPLTPLPHSPSESNPVLCCGVRYCSASFQSFVLRHLVIAPVRNTKKPLAADTSISTDVFRISSNMTREVEVDRIKTIR